jgi:hypothetical protein
VWQREDVLGYVRGLGLYFSEYLAGSISQLGIRSKRAIIDSAPQRLEKKSMLHALGNAKPPDNIS